MLFLLARELDISVQNGDASTIFHIVAIGTAFIAILLMYPIGQSEAGL